MVMSTRTRYFLVGAGLILVVGLGTGLVAYYAGELPLGGMRHRTGDLAYVPSDASIVAYADVRAVMHSEFRQHLRQVIPDGSEQQQFQNETGIDIERDVDSVTAVLGSTTGGNGDGTLVLVRGALNPLQIETYLVQHGAVAEDYLGKRLLKNSPQAGSDKGGGCVAFLDPGLVALGSEAAIKRAIDGAGGSVNSNAEMTRLIGEVDGHGDTVWAVGRLDKIPNAAAVPGAVKDQLAAVQWFAVSGHVDGGINGVVRLEARDDQAAENLRAIVNGGLALAHLQMGKDSKIDGVINSLQLTGTGKDVQLAFSVPAEVLDVVNGIAGLANLQGVGKKMIPK
jgi:hypothetical protein